MTTIYSLWHIYDRDGEEESKYIGDYSTEENAKAAISRLRDKAGFRDWPDGFEIFENVLDRDGWTEGFFSYAEAAQEVGQDEK
jgi:hypothetical protein